MNLSLEQWGAVRSPGNSLVISVPGAGKTRVIQAKAIQEAAKLVDRPHRIACLTYTNAAVTELKRRILPSLRAEARDKIFIGTIHSFCIKQIIAPYAGRLSELANGHRVVTLSDPVAVETVEEILGHEASAGELKTFENLRRASNGAAIEPDIAQRKRIEAYWALLLAKGCIEFTGVLLYATRILQGQTDVKATIASVFRWLLVDEYQDTSVEQLAIFRSIAEARRSSWMLVGDLNQSIFSFNGVSRAALIEFSTFLDCVPVTLAQTYRCARAICEHASSLMPEPEMKPTFNEPAGDVITFFGDVRQSVALFVDELKKRSIPLSSSAIIASQKWALDQALGALEALEPTEPWAHRYWPGATTLTRLVSSILACVHHPRRVEHLMDGLANLAEVVVLAGYKSRLEFPERLLVRIIDDVERRGLQNVRFSDTASLIMAHIKVELPPQLGVSVDTILEIGIRPKLLRDSPLLTLSGASLARLACDHDAITVATIHQAKGLEFRAVLLAAYEQGVLPRTGPDNDAAEEARKAYVAITRSSEFLMYAMRDWKKSSLWARTIDGLRSS